jgi:hypothetical protein
LRDLTDWTTRTIRSIADDVGHDGRQGYPQEIIPPVDAFKFEAIVLGNHNWVLKGDVK